MKKKKLIIYIYIYIYIEREREREREVNISKNWQIQVKLNKKSSNLNFILFDANSKWIINSKHAKGWKIKTYKSEFMSTTCLRLIADKHSNLLFIYIYIYIYIVEKV